MSDRNDLRLWSFVGLLVGGLLILVGALVGAFMMGAYGWVGMGGMMGAYPTAGWFAGIAWWMTGIGVVTGGLVLAAALQVYRGRDPALWGVVGIAAGALSLFAMGGFLVGATAAILGGAIAVGLPGSAAPRRA